MPTKKDLGITIELTIKERDDLKGVLEKLLDTIKTPGFVNRLDLHPDEAKLISDLKDVL
jgi:uncharacterized protein YcgL (UPF0745 family)